MAPLRPPSASLLRHLRQCLFRFPHRSSSNTSKHAFQTAAAQPSHSPSTHSQTKPTPPPRRRRLLRPLLLLPLTTLITIYPALDFFTTHILQVMTVTGPSMSPLLNTDHTQPHSTGAHDRVLVSMYKPKLGLHRGDVVAFWSPVHPERMVVKRVVGVEGDVVLPRAGSEHVGGAGFRGGVRKSGEEQLPLTRMVMNEAVVIPTGHLWVEGEHPDGDKRSYDSNTYGPVSRSLVVGKVLGVVWPWHRAGWIRWQDWAGSNRVRVEASKVERFEIYGM